MLLNSKYHVGSDGGKLDHGCFQEPGVKRLPGWQRWGKLDHGCFQEPDATRLAATGVTRKFDHGCFYRNPALPGWQRWMLNPSDDPWKPPSDVHGRQNTEEA